MLPEARSTRSILIVDDHVATREGLKALLELRAGWQVCSTAASCEEALQAARVFQPELIILDLRLPDCESSELIPQLRTLCPHSPILAISLGVNSRSTKAALDAGAQAFLHKDSLRHSLHQTVEALFTNHTPAI